MDLTICTVFVTMRRPLYAHHFRGARCVDADIGETQELLLQHLVRAFRPKFKSVTCEQMPAKSMAASTPELLPPTTAPSL